MKALYILLIGFSMAIFSCNNDIGEKNPGYGLSESELDEGKYPIEAIERDTGLTTSSDGEIIKYTDKSEQPDSMTGIE